MLELISIHVPKTGGRSFREILFQVYDERKVTKLNRNELTNAKAPVTKELLGQAAVLHGHLSYEQVRRLHLSTGAKLVTWLRNPVERIFSNYCFRLRRALEGSVSTIGSEAALDDFARKPGQRNQMASFLEGIELAEMFFVGVTECFSADVQDLGRRLHWDEFDLVWDNANTNFKRKIPPPSPQQRELVRRLNERDVALYQEALELRNERLGIKI